MIHLQFFQDFSMISLKFKDIETIQSMSSYKVYVFKLTRIQNV